MRHAYAFAHSAPISPMKRDAKYQPQEPIALFVRPTTPRSVGTKGQSPTPAFLLFIHSLTVREFRYILLYKTIAKMSRQ